MAFQIMDDILDFRGDEARLGKPVANDLRQGIVTLPVLIFLDSQPNHPVILKAVAKERCTTDEINQVVKQIRASGSIEKALAEARSFAIQAQEALLALPDNEYRHALSEIANFTISRDV
jgi:geranylgeranyl pyrophosphate synthase